MPDLTKEATAQNPLKERRPQMTVNNHITALRVKKDPTSKTVADAFDVHQKYLDALGRDMTAVIDELNGFTGGADGGGGAEPPPVPSADLAPPVMIVDPPQGATEVRTLYDYEEEIRVYYVLDPTAVMGVNYSGVTVFLEDPDVSALPNAPMDGSVALNGTTQLSGTWNPQLVMTSQASPAVFRIPSSTKDRLIRVYLASYGPVANSILTRANVPIVTGQPAPTPNRQIKVPAVVSQYVRGQEYAPLIYFVNTPPNGTVDPNNPSALVIEDFENPAGPMFWLRFFMTEPDPTIPLPPGMAPYGGVQTVYEFADKTRKQGPFLDAHKPDKWVSDEYPATTETFIVYFCSADVNQRVNSVVAGVTPFCTVTVTYPPAGGTIVPPVQGFHIGGTYFTVLPDYSVVANAVATWAPPDSKRYSGIHFYRTNIEPPRLDSSNNVIDPVWHIPQDVGNNVSTEIFATSDFPNTNEVWTITAIAVDSSGKEADDPYNLSGNSPQAPWNIGPNTPGTGVNGIGAWVLAEVPQESQSDVPDGIPRMRCHFKWTNPVNVNNFSGMSIARIKNDDINNPVWFDAAVSDSEMWTAWEPAPLACKFDFYLVSRDQQGHRNTPTTSQPKWSPSIQFVPDSGYVIPGRKGTPWWDQNEFDWPLSGAFITKLIAADKIQVGSSLRVGGGTGSNISSFYGNQNGQITVYNSSNQVVAWMGEQDNLSMPDGTTGNVWGAWFKQLYVGGSQPINAPIWIDNQGIITVGGIQAAAGYTYPFISIKNDHGGEVGRIGAVIAPPSLVGSGNAAAGISGAWFTDFAIGGASVADWRVLARTDPTTQRPYVKMQQIDLFSIDWAAGAPSTQYPGHPNNPTHLEFGSDSFVASMPDTAYYKFPGMTITNTAPVGQPNQYFGSTLITRGIITGAPGVQPNSRRISLIIFNGDQHGGDLTTNFWGELSLYSPLSNNVISAYLSSGYLGKSGSWFYLKDNSQQWWVNFDCGINPQKMGLHNLWWIDTNGNFQKQIMDNYGNLGDPTLGLTLSGPLNANGGLEVTGGTTLNGAVTINSTLQVAGLTSLSTLTVNNAANFSTVTATGAITGASLSAGTGDVSGNSLTLGGKTAAKTDLIWEGGLQSNNPVYGSAFGIYGVAFGVTGPTTFTTADGKTVTVQGGIIIKIQ